MSSSARVTIESEAVPQPSRRRHSIMEKRRIVEATLTAGTSVARVAREHGVNANLVFGWRRLYQRGLLGGNAPAATLLPVKLAEAPVPPEPVRSTVPSGSIQLRLPKGQLRIDGTVDPASLRLVLECLLG